MNSHPTPWTVDQSYKQDDPWISIVDANGSVALTTTGDADLPLTQELAYRIVAAVNEVERLRADFADKDLALAMARGEGWPEGWEWSESDEGYQSPADDAYIQPKTVNHLGPKGMEGAPLGWSLYRRDKKIRGMSISDKATYPDALSALRAYQAKATP